MLYHLRIHCLLLCLLLLAGCPGYDVKLNERVVYSPQPLLGDFTVTDSALLICLQETIKNQTIRRPEELTALNCSSAGIESLEGLAAFFALKQLKLSSNRIRNLVELEKLANLNELYLDNNRIIDPVPLYQLPHLKTLDLSGNPRMQCPGGAGFSTVVTVFLPEHCR